MKKELRQALGPLFQTPLGKNDYIVERKPASIVAPVYPGEIMFVRDHASSCRAMRGRNAGFFRAAVLHREVLATGRTWG